MERRQFLKSLGISATVVGTTNLFATDKKVKSLGLQLFSV